MTEPGHRRYVGVLGAIADRTGEPGLARLVEDLRAPLRVSVAGRPGAGCRTVARVLRGAGVTVVGAGEACDLDVYVLAEAAKPEDRSALATATRPCVAVLNKADLTRAGGSEPLAAAAALGRLLESQSGVPTRPLVALLADANIDDEMFAALGVLAGEPADLGSTDRFVEARHRLPRATRERLLSRLDLFGIAHAVAAVRRGCGRAEVTAALRRVSAVAELLADIEAPVRYRRIVEARPRLLELARGPRVGDVLAGDLLAGDEVVIAAMAAAADAVTAAGLPVDRAETCDGLLRAAVRWQRYADGPVTPLHRACGTDLARGALRLWARSGGEVRSPP